MEKHAHGWEVYLGTSSNWSFVRRLLSITHQHVNKTPLPTNALLFDATAYSLDWNGYRTGDAPEMPALPTQDYAIYLVNAVKFHCGQMFHLFDEETFMKSLGHFYSDPNPRPDPTDLWFIHYLLILSFGKAFTTKTSRGRRPPGHDFFVKAMQLLPDLVVLLREPVLSTEILCCVSLYMQCIDFRHHSNNFVRASSSGSHPTMTIDLQEMPDRPGSPVRTRGRHAHGYAGTAAWRVARRKMSQAVVDGAYPGQGDDIPVWPAAVDP